MEAIKIRKAKKKDWEQIFKLSIKVWRTAYANIMPQEIFEHREATSASILEKRKDIEPNTSDHFAFVAEAKNEIVAFALVQTISNYEHYKQLGYSDLYAIYIDPHYQHKRLGKKLFDLAVKQLLEAGFTKMVIGVLKENLQARVAYEKWGGMLDSYESYYKKLDFTFAEVFYIYHFKDNEIQLKKATVSDSKTIFEMQIKSFKPLLEKYKDYKTNPGAETLEKIKSRFNFDNVDHFLIMLREKAIGCIRIQNLVQNIYRLSQIFIIPSVQNKGYAQSAVAQAELLYPNATKWVLDTIKQETALCHLYEKMGFCLTGVQKNITPNLDLVYYEKQCAKPQ